VKSLDASTALQFTVKTTSGDADIFVSTTNSTVTKNKYIFFFFQIIDK
jgi:hypothetical protein